MNNHVNNFNNHRVDFNKHINDDNEYFTSIKKDINGIHKVGWLSLGFILALQVIPKIAEVVHILTK